MKAWEQFETEIAEIFHGVRQAGSGNSCLAPKKGDIKSKLYLIECKYTEKPVYVLTAKTWEKIVGEALCSLKIPLFTAQNKTTRWFVGMEVDFPSFEYERVIVSPHNIKLGNEGSFLVKDFKTDTGIYNLVCRSEKNVLL